MGSSVALGVIAGKCGSLRLVLAGPAGCLRGRWRSGPRKRRHAAGSRARVSKHRAPVGALRHTSSRPLLQKRFTVSKHRAPVGALRPHHLQRMRLRVRVSKHRAPVGALRQPAQGLSLHILERQQAPCTCRCIKTGGRGRRGRSRCRQQAPCTCRCIKTREDDGVHFISFLRSASTVHL